MLSTISPNLLPRAVDQLWQCCGGSGSHGAIGSATLASQLFAQEWKSAELHRAQAEAGGKTVTMSSADATRAREEARVRDDMALISRLWDEVKDRLSDNALGLSGGQQQRLVIARAIAIEPEVLLLDEPSMGLAPMVISQIFKIIAEINSTGTTVLLVEQNAQQALSRSDRAYILETGEITRTGNARDLLADDSIRAAYLGVA